MLSPVAEPELWLSADEVEVEAGGYAELELAPDLPGLEGAEDAFAIGIVGLEASWHTLSAPTLHGTRAQGAKALLVIHPPRGPRLTSPGEYSFRIQVVSSSGGELLQRTVSLRVLPPGAAAPSRFLNYLPGIYAGDDFTNRFLNLFQSLLDPVEAAVDNTRLRLDPDVAPPDVLAWLATWVGLQLDPCQDEASQRLLIRNAVQLARCRGTRRGLEGELKLRLGGRPLVVENFDGLKLGPEAALGLNTQLGQRMDASISVTMVNRAGSEVDPQLVSGLVADLKPAHTGHLARVAAWPISEEGMQHG